MAPLIVIESAEEARVLESFRHANAQVLRPLYRWSITEGLKRLDMDEDDDAGIAPDASYTLQAIRQSTQRGIYLLLDFNPYLRYPMVLRLLREIVQRHDSEAHTLVLIAPKVELPEELVPYVTHYRPSLPDLKAIADMLRAEAFAYSRETGRRVEVGVEVTPERFEVRIADEGPGFDTNVLPSMSEEALTRQCGRGLAMIQMVMDEVVHNAKGNEVRLVLRKKAQAAE